MGRSWLGTPKKMEKNNHAGFSLLEVMISVGILAMVVVTISTGWSGNLLRVRQSRLKHNVAALLERKAVEIETKFHGQPIDEIVDESGDFGSEFKKYRWDFKIKEFQMPDLAPILISRDEGADDLLLSMVSQMTEFISNSVKEGTLSVIVKLGKKEVKYSITMYFVDYNQPLPLGGG